MYTCALQSPNPFDTRGYCMEHHVYPFMEHCEMSNQNDVKSALGFTLIELLVVISIISLLISILLPALGSARASSRSIQCGSNLRGVGMAVSMYSQDNRQEYPTNQVKPDGVNTLAWQEYIGGTYLNIDRRWPNWAADYRPPTVFGCPASDLLMNNGNKGDYSGVYYLFNDWNKKPYRQEQILNPSQTLLIVEGFNQRAVAYWGGTNINGELMMLHGRHKQGLANNDPNNTVNSLFCDGHVQTNETGFLSPPLASKAGIYGKSPWKPKTSS